MSLRTILGVRWRDYGNSHLDFDDFQKRVICMGLNEE